MLKIFKAWILNPSKRNVAFFVFSASNKKIIYDEEAQSSGSKWGLKEKKN
jgi:hypothetical protein